jgi:HEPN domain-containing protein
VENVVSLELFLPKRIAERLKKESEKTGASEEEPLVEGLSEKFGEHIDPASEVEMHLRLSEKELMEAEELLRKGDYVQASEKAWGAAAQLVKAVAAREGRTIRSYGELHREVARIVKETGDEELRRLWQSAGMLHKNFYENWFPREMVEGNIRDVKRFVEKLRQLLNY